MADVVGRGVIELVADARLLKAGIEDAKKAIRTLGEGQKDISASASQSIDKYIGKLQAQNATIGKSARETELYKLALRGASNEQIRSADAAIRLAESHARTSRSIDALKTGFISLGVVATTGLVAAAAAFDHLVKRTGDFQDMAEKVGDTGKNIASLAVSASVGGIAMESVVQASVRLTKGLTGVDDESKAAGAGITALGLDLDKFKQLAPADQIEAVAKALEEFKDDQQKAAVAVALFGRAGAEMLPFLKELAQTGGRQNILTDEQIRLADIYSDKQKRLTAEISLYAGAIASEMLPAYNDLKAAFLDVLKGIAGVQEGIKGLKSSTDIQEFAETGAKVLATLIDAIDFVVRGFQLVGKTIALSATVDIEFLKSNWRGALDAAKGFAEEAKAIINRPFASDVLATRLAFRKAEGPFKDDFDKDINTPKKKLNFEGALKKGTDNARAEAAAQLALDLEQIKKAGEAIAGAFANGEKIMEALRAAALVDERDYYEAKRGFITINAQVREKELREEIARIEKEKFTGKTADKDRIDQKRKVADLEAQIAKVLAEASTATTVATIQETAEIKKKSRAMIEATKASEEYIASIERRNERELEGIGRGTKFREQSAGINEIGDKLIAERQRIERDRRNNPQIADQVFDDYLKVAQETYAKEVALYMKRTAAITEAEGDWLTGAKEALSNYYEASRNIAQQTEQAFTNAFQGLEDMLLEFVKTQKLNFKGLVLSILSDFARMQIKQNITGPLAKLFLGAIGGLAGGAGSANAITPSATGGHRSAGQMLLVGEQGPELFRPDSAGTVIPSGGWGGGGGNQFIFNLNGGPPIDSEAFLAQVVPVMRAVAQSEMGNQLRPGGIFNS